MGCGGKQSFGTRFYLMGSHLSILIRWLLIYEEVCHQVLKWRRINNDEVFDSIRVGDTVKGWMRKGIPAQG